MIIQFVIVICSSFASSGSCHRHRIMLTQTVHYALARVFFGFFFVLPESCWNGTQDNINVFTYNVEPEEAHCDLGADDSHHLSDRV